MTDTELFLRGFGLLMLLCGVVIAWSFVKHMRARNRYVRNAWNSRHAHHSFWAGETRGKTECR
jgi:uncharacterized BrkB/YihY/UPF0761 family membrane protein